MDQNTYRHEELRPDIERYARSEGVSFERAWETLHTPFDDMTDAQVALASHMLGWSLRDYGLDDKVSVSIGCDDG